jgi:hypothetical protein
MKHSQATIRLLSRMRRGKNNPFFGKKHSQETIARMRERAARMKYHERRTYDLQPVTIAKLTAEGWAYLVGIVDGEGSIAMKREQPQISVYNGCLPLMKYLASAIGGAYRVADRKGRSPNYCWNIGGVRNVYFAINELIPFLIIKRDVALNVRKRLQDKYGERLDG